MHKELRNSPHVQGHVQCPWIAACCPGLLQFEVHLKFCAMFILPAFSFDNFFDVKQEIKTALALDVFTQPCQPMSLTQGFQVVLHMKLLHCVSLTYQSSSLVMYM